MLPMPALAILEEGQLPKTSLCRAGNRVLVLVFPAYDEYLSTMWALDFRFAYQQDAAGAGIKGKTYLVNQFLIDEAARVALVQLPDLALADSGSPAYPLAVAHLHSSHSL